MSIIDLYLIWFACFCFWCGFFYFGPYPICSLEVARGDWWPSLMTVKISSGFTFGELLCHPSLSIYVYNKGQKVNFVPRQALKLLTASAVCPLVTRPVCSLWPAGDPEELGGSSSWRRGIRAGVRADALSPRPRPEDTPHAAHAVPLLRQVGPTHCLTYKRSKEDRDTSIDQ